MLLRLRGVRRHPRARLEVLRKLASYGAFNAVGRSTADSVAYDGADADAELVVDVLFATVDRAAVAAGIFESDYDAEASVTRIGRVQVRRSDRALGDRISLDDYVKDDVSPPLTARATSNGSTPASNFTTADRASWVYKFQRFEVDSGYTPEMMHLVSKRDCEAAIKAADDSDDGLREVVVFHFLNDVSRCPANFLCGFHGVHELFDALGSQPEPRLLVLAAEDAEYLEAARVDGDVDTRLAATRASLLRAALPAACAHARGAGQGRAHEALSILEERGALPGSGAADADAGADADATGGTAAAGPIVSVSSIDECGAADRVEHSGAVLFGVKVVIVASETWLATIMTLSSVTHVDGHHRVATLYTKQPHIFRLCLRYKVLASLREIDRDAWPELNCSM